MSATAKDLLEHNPLASAPLTVLAPGTRVTAVLVPPGDQVVPFALARTVPLPRVSPPRTGTYSSQLQVSVDDAQRPLTETMDREWTWVGSEDSSDGHTEETWGWEG